MRNRRQVTRLLGETLREIGILAFVLAPLDATFSGAQTTGGQLMTAMLLGAILIFVGLAMETLDDR